MFARTRTVSSKTQTKTKPLAKTPIKADKDVLTPSQQLNIVSWNISSAEPSQAAPDRVARFQNAPLLIREEVLRTNPEIIALQETASPTQGSDIFRDYISIGTREALHTREYVDLLVRRDAFTSYEQISLPNLPAVGSVLSFHGTKIVVVSIHLPHTKEAAPFRKQLCQSIIQYIEVHDVDDVILIGDFNMRKDEDTSVEQMAGGLTDAWKEIGNSDKKKMFTWNGRDNLYHGPESFKFTARFDRCYVRGDKIRLREFDLVGNQIVEKKGDYLSDHYGMFVRCDINISARDSNAPSDKNKSVPSSNHQPDCGDSIASSAVGNRLSGENGTNNNRQLSAQELRLIRLQRFETNSNTNQCEVETSARRDNENATIDLTEDSDDENEMHAKKKTRVDK